MTKNGVDSADEPTQAQVQAAQKQGIQFWGLYLRGPGATHDWSVAGTEVLRAANMLPLPIYVPATVNGRISSTDPATDAKTFVAAYQARAMNGAGVLDTEESMRGFPETGPYTASFMTTLRSLGQADICYAGGFVLGGPPQATYKWWIGIAGDPAPTEAIQRGSGEIAGINVDLDFAGDSFPFSDWTTQAKYPKPETTVHALLVEANGALRVTCPFCKHTYDVEKPEPGR